MKSVLATSLVCVTTAAVLTQSVTAQGGDPITKKLSAAGKAMMAYASDFDDRLPMAFARDTNGKNHWNQVSSVPATERLDQQIWANTLAPYWGKNALEIEGPTYAFNQTASGEKIGITLNGLLHSLEISSIAHKPLVPVLWTPYGKMNTIGALANPVLSCYNVETCTYSNGKVSTSAMKGPAELSPFGDRLYEITLDLNVKKPMAYGLPKDWKTSVYVRTESGLAMTQFESSLKGWPDHRRAAAHFAPDRSE